MAARTKSRVTPKSYRPCTDEVPHPELGGIRESASPEGRHHRLVRCGRHRCLERALILSARRPAMVLRSCDSDGLDPAHCVPPWPPSDRGLRLLVDRPDGPRPDDSDPVRMDHTTLSRRGSFLDVPTSATRTEGPLHLVIDSTGVKIVGDGEWHCHKHSAKNERRRWCKLHIGAGDDGIFVASELTDSSVDDAVVGAELLEQLAVPVASFRGDGAYDTKAYYAALAKAGMQDIDIVIPPRRTAVPSRSAEGTWRQRPEALDRIAQVGRRQWRKESGAHQQARGPSRPAGTGCSGTNGSSVTVFVGVREKDRRPNP